MSEVAPIPTEAPRPAGSRLATRQLWVERLTRFAASGLRPAAFCAQEGVSLPSFYAWKRRLAVPDDTTSTLNDPGPRLLPVRLPAPVAVEVILPHDALLRLTPGCDLGWVRSLVEALGGLPC
jgi:transposase